MKQLKADQNSEGKTDIGLGRREWMSAACSELIGRRLDGQFWLQVPKLWYVS